MAQQTNEDRDRLGKALDEVLADAEPPEALPPKEKTSKRVDIKADISERGRPVFDDGRVKVKAELDKRPAADAGESSLEARATADGEPLDMELKRQPAPAEAPPTAGESTSQTSAKERTDAILPADAALPPHPEPKSGSRPAEQGSGGSPETATSRSRSRSRRGRPETAAVVRERTDPAVGVHREPGRAPRFSGRTREDSLGRAGEYGAEVDRLAEYEESGEARPGREEQKRERRENRKRIGETAAELAKSEAGRQARRMAGKAVGKAAKAAGRSALAAIAETAPVWAPILLAAILLLWFVIVMINVGNQKVTVDLPGGGHKTVTLAESYG